MKRKRNDVTSAKQYFLSAVIAGAATTVLIVAAIALGAFRGDFVTGADGQLVIDPISRAPLRATSPFANPLGLACLFFSGTLAGPLLLLSKRTVVRGAL